MAGVNEPSRARPSDCQLYVVRAASERAPATTTMCQSSLFPDFCILLLLNCSVALLYCVRKGAPLLLRECNRPGASISFLLKSFANQVWVQLNEWMTRSLDQIRTLLLCSNHELAFVRDGNLIVIRSPIGHWLGNCSPRIPFFISRRAINPWSCSYLYLFWYR